MRALADPVTTVLPSWLTVSSARSTKCSPLSSRISVTVAFEVSVFELMIRYANRQSLVTRIGRGPAWNGPRDQDAIDLQAEVEVQLPRLV